MKRSRRQLLQQCIAGVTYYGAQRTALSMDSPIAHNALVITPHVAIRGMLASAFSSTDGTFGLTILDRSTQDSYHVSLPARGHDVIAHPNGSTLVVFARRPGTYLKVITAMPWKEAVQVNSVTGRHFYGHGCFDRSGSRLFATENDYENGRGVIGVYDCTDAYRRIGEFPSYGIGPHDVQLLSDGHTVAIANGGIETHPDFGREKLNLTTMRSSLSLIDTRDGSLVKDYRLPESLQRLSIRHLTINAQGSCCFGAQYEGAMEDQPPLVGSINRAGKFKFAQPPGQINAQLKNYINSIACIPHTNTVLTSSARGGVTVAWNSTTWRVQTVIKMFDNSGIAASEDAVYVSGGSGQINRFAEGLNASLSETIYDDAATQWDNHMTWIRET